MDISPPTSATLPSQSDLTVWFDPSDLSTLFQDAAGTTPVTADGDPVGRIEDKSGNGNHATQSSASLKPTYKTSGGLHWIEFDGTEYMDLVTTFDGAVGSDNTAVCGNRIDDTTTRAIFGSTGNEGLEMLFQTGLIRPYIGTVSGDIGGNGSTNISTTDFVFTTEWDRSAGSLKGWQDRNLEVNLTGTAADKQNGANSWFGCTFSAGVANFDGRVYGLAIYDVKLSDADRATAESFMAEKSGVTLVPPSAYCDAMTLVEAAASNSGSVIDGMNAVITNDGGGAGFSVIAATTTVTSSTGKLSIELKINSNSNDSGGSADIVIYQSATPVIQLKYNYSTGNLTDIGSNVLANFSYVAGETVIGLTIDQANETATYSYKVDDETAASANANLPVSGYSNAAASTLAMLGATVTSASMDLTLNTGTAEFVTNVDGQGYCDF
jgi:hypothetical protein